jgi:hypothetical protein
MSDHRKPLQNRAPLQPARFLALPPGAVRPTGWLYDQLRVQADGRTGQLESFWPSVGPESGWLGGTGESWERGPYYLDGLVPLAYILNDDRLKAQAQKWIEWTLQSQTPDGWFGPKVNEDWWPRMVMLKVLIQYYEATGDDRIIPFMQRYCQYQHAHLKHRPLQHWAAARGGENVLSVLWLYNQTGEAYLLELAEELRQQTIDWGYLFEAFPHRGYTTRDRVGMENHVVNNAMAVKYPALFWQQTGTTAHRHGAIVGIQNLMHYHGQPQGIWSGDELFAGTHPSQGTELCGVVEYMFSLEHLARIFGEAEYADILEKVAYNALPAGMTADMWGHQYNQQPNQVLCSKAKRPFTWTNDESNCFGLEPFYGCCTANYHQGWPKFAASLWAATAEGGLAAVAYAPCEVEATVAGDVPVKVVVETEYPFRETVRCTVTPAQAAKFAIEFRIPGWVKGATLLVNGEPLNRFHPYGGHYAKVEREWQPGDVVELAFPMAIRLTDRPTNRAICVERGPLLYSLAVGEEWQRLKGEDICPTWEVHPTTPWNYGLVVDRIHPERSFKVETGPISKPAFTAEQAPVRLVGTGRQVPEWELKEHSADAPPISPVAPETPAEAITLVPYGAARLRITEFPWGK